MRFNTLFQLLALQRDRSPLLEMAESLLMMPDLFHFFLTGVQSNELTDASTTQMYNPTARDWAHGLINVFGLPAKILGKIIQPGTVIGPLCPSVAADTGLPAVPVISPATHDTGSAVAAVPAATDVERGAPAPSAVLRAPRSTGNWAYISSGTWSLMGVELDGPMISDEALRYNFTNEGGVGGTIRFLKNIMGLWLVQECRRAWQRSGRDYGYEELARLAESTPPFVSLVDPDDTAFILPLNMPAALAEFCRNTGQPIPVEPGPVVRSRPGKPGTPVSLGFRALGGNARPSARGHPRGGRRQPKHPALPIHGRRLQPPSPGRSC